MIADRLRKARQRMGLKQQELAQRCGFGINQINRYENEGSDPPSENLRIMAEQLSVSTDYLLGLTNDPQGIVVPNDLLPDEREMVEIYRREGWPGVIRLGGEKFAEYMNKQLD